MYPVYLLSISKLDTFQNKPLDMALLSQGVKDRISTVVGVAKTAFHWGFMPTVLYLGFQKGAEPGMPELNLASLLWA